MNTRRTAAATLALGLALTACGEPEEGQRTGSISREAVREAREKLPPELTAALDSGNAAYRREEYEAARSHFETVLGRDSTVASAWFGLYMVEKALGNQEAADDALERVRRLTESTSRSTPPAPGAPEDGSGDGRG